MSYVNYNAENGRIGYHRQEMYSFNEYKLLNS